MSSEEDEIRSLFGSFSPDAGKEALDQVGGDSRFLPALPVGTSALRMMPPPRGSDAPWVVVRQHFVRVGEKLTVVNCAAHMAGERCPVCLICHEFNKSGDPAKIALADSWRAGVRIFANVIDRRAPEKGPMIWGFGQQILKQLVNFRDNQMIYGQDFTDPLSGRDLIVHREGQAKSTKWTVNLSHEKSSLARSITQAKDWSLTAPSLDDLAKIASFEEVQAKLLDLDPSMAHGTMVLGPGIAVIGQGRTGQRAMAGATSQRVGDVSVSPRSDDDVPF